VGVIGDAVPWMLHSHTAYLGAFAQNATSILAMQRRKMAMVFGARTSSARSPNWVDAS